MYSFDPTQEQQMLIDAVGKFASNNLRVFAREAEESRELPKRLISKGWEIGLLQASVPESYGGFGERNAVTGVLALEAMAFGDMAGTLAVLTPSLFATPILLAGSEEQKKEYLPKVIEGGWSLYTAALIEYAFDFDPNELRTTAALNGDEYILNGEKALSRLQRMQNLSRVRTSEWNNKPSSSRRFRRINNSDEREKTDELNALSVISSQAGECESFRTDRLGGAAVTTLNRSSLRCALPPPRGCGVGNAAFEYSRDYAREREVFGVKVAQKRLLHSCSPKCGRRSKPSVCSHGKLRGSWTLARVTPVSNLSRFHRRGRYGDDGHRPRGTDPWRARIYP